MSEVKIKCEFTKQEIEDIWSAVAIWGRTIDNVQNPLTKKALDKLARKLKKIIRSKNVQQKAK